MSAIHRRSVVHLSVPFRAPDQITLCAQPQRPDGFTLSVWYPSDRENSCSYVVLATGVLYPGPLTLIATACVEGYHFYHVYHLCRIEPQTVGI